MNKENKVKTQNQENKQKSTNEIETLHLIYFDYLFFCFIFHNFFFIHSTIKLCTMKYNQTGHTIHLIVEFVCCLIVRIN